MIAIIGKLLTITVLQLLICSSISDHHVNNHKNKQLLKNGRSLELDVSSVMNDCKTHFRDISEEECIDLHRKLGISDEQLSGEYNLTPTRDEKQNRKRQVSQANILQMLPYNLNNILRLCTEAIKLGPENATPIINTIPANNRIANQGVPSNSFPPNINPQMINSQIPYNTKGLHLINPNLQQQQQQTLSLSQIQHLLNTLKSSPQSRSLDLQNRNHEQLNSNNMLSPLLQYLQKNNANEKYINDILKHKIVPRNLIGGYPNLENNQNQEATDIEPFIRQKLIETQNMDWLKKIDNLKRECALEQLSKYLGNANNNAALQSQIARSLGVHHNSKREPYENDPLGLINQNAIFHPFADKSGDQLYNQLYGENALLKNLNEILRHKIQKDETMDGTYPQSTVVIDNKNLNSNSLLFNDAYENESSERGFVNKTKTDEDLRNKVDSESSIQSKNSSVDIQEKSVKTQPQDLQNRSDVNTSSSGIIKNMTDSKKVNKTNLDKIIIIDNTNLKENPTFFKNKETVFAPINNKEALNKSGDVSSDVKNITETNSKPQNDEDMHATKHKNHSIENNNKVSELSQPQSDKDDAEDKANHPKSDSNKKSKKLDRDTHQEDSKEDIGVQDEKSDNDVQISKEDLSIHTSKDADEVQTSKEDLDVHKLNNAEDAEVSKEELSIHASISVEDDQKSKEETGTDSSKDAENVQMSKEVSDIHASNSDEDDKKSGEELDVNSLKITIGDQESKENTSESEEDDENFNEELKNINDAHSSKEELGLQESKSVEEDQNSREDSSQHGLEKNENVHSSKEELDLHVSKSAEDEQKSKEDLEVNSQEHGADSSNFATHINTLENSKRKTII